MYQYGLDRMSRFAVAAAYRMGGREKFIPFLACSFISSKANGYALPDRRARETGIGIAEAYRRSTLTKP
jgi:hypothetical protein